MTDVTRGKRCRYLKDRTFFAVIYPAGQRSGHMLHVTKQGGDDYAMQIGEQRVSFSIAELRRETHVKNRQIGIAGDRAHIES